ncbi:aminotransferase class I/II-fold pyridoxal phosphate-dependent enzyme [Streptomyces winkii]|uniref:aminotransferase class I/II-fold pyridoxal phosphate-dependent enzyme n=1 Tax=Streptomyces winkii TaxID=3051178 RepID=UPI0028D15CEA|nr:aminotransferase class I/II-fold pyridoxal phosphate-dependent enzyme [Streptomyces sp. DSM 40971]
MEGSDDTCRQVRSAAAVAACGYWQRRGMDTRPEQVVAAPSAPLLLLAVLAATGSGTVLTPRPGEGWYTRSARLLGRRTQTVPVPAECGGVPDPVALRETVRRERTAGHEPRVLLLSVADDCTGTAVPPELLHEVIEAAGDERLLIVSDETWRDTTHAPHSTVIVSPAEMVHGGRETDAVVVLAGLGETLLPQGAPGAGIGRFPHSGRGRGLAESVREVLKVLRTGLSGPHDAAVADALTEPESLRSARAATARAHGTLLTGLHRAVTAAGALCRPPRVGRHVYADFEPLRPRLDARRVRDSPALEAHLAGTLGPYVCGGHRLGDDPEALRVRLSGGLLTGPEQPGPAASPGGSRVLDSVETALAELTALRE